MHKTQVDGYTIQRRPNLVLEVGGWVNGPRGAPPHGGKSYASAWEGEGGGVWRGGPPSRISHRNSAPLYKVKKYKN